MATLKSKGDNGSPCFTPLVIGIFGVSSLASVKCVLASVYGSTTASIYNIKHYAKVIHKHTHQKSN
jgi:hypothetical protein